MGGRSWGELIGGDTIAGKAFCEIVAVLTLKIYLVTEMCG
jgi:hypothetical protein